MSKFEVGDRVRTRREVSWETEVIGINEKATCALHVDHYTLRGETGRSDYGWHDTELEFVDDEFDRWARRVRKQYAADQSNSV